MSQQVINFVKVTFSEHWADMQPDTPSQGWATFLSTDCRAYVVVSYAVGHRTRTERIYFEQPAGVHVRGQSLFFDQNRQGPQPISSDERDVLEAKELAYSGART